MNINLDELKQVPEPQPKEDVMAYHVNHIIQFGGVNANLVSDGYHTFAELYEHRITLFIALCQKMADFPEKDTIVWRSKKHSDGSEWDGWFIMGIGVRQGEQISYHLPISKWDETGFCETRIMAPEWDGHTSNDVLERLKQL